MRPLGSQAHPSPSLSGRNDIRYRPDGSDHKDEKQRSLSADSDGDSAAAALVVHDGWRWAVSCDAEGISNSFVSRIRDSNVFFVDARTREEAAS
jgi:hypothetical protein